MRLPVFRHAPGAIAIDLDGTLLDSNSQLSARNLAAIENCLARAIPIIIATSRPARSVRRLLGEGLMQKCSMVMQNGAIAIGAPPFTGHFKEPIPRDIITEIIALALRLEPDTHVILELEGYEFGTNHPREPSALRERNSATPEMQLPLEPAMAAGPTKIAVGGLKRDMSHVAKAISECFGDVLSIVPSDGKILLNITSAKATKPNALEKILSSRDITLKDVVAFGDDFPDLELLSTCGTSIAMANAIPEIKAVCDFRTLSNDEDGVAVALEQMLKSLA